MDHLLTDVSLKEDIKSFYGLIQRDPFLLEQIDRIPFVNTPLHHIASAGQILSADQLAFALEVARLKPSFVRKLNQDGVSPLELALQNGHKQFVLCLVEIDPELVKIKGREGVTLLHLATAEKDPDFVEELLSVGH